MSPAELARRLFEEHKARVKFHPLSAADAVARAEDAYAVQAHYVQLLKRSEGEAVGYKIGLTSQRMQKMCGIDSPVAGVVLAERVHHSGASLKVSDYGHLGVEFEIAVRIGRDVEPGAQPLTLETIAPSVSEVCAAVELVDDRHADYALMNAVSLIADNSWNAGIVLGQWRSEWPSLRDVEGRVLQDGEEIDSGFGRDVLGHPFTPLAWLANHLHGRGQALRQGDVVLTGSLVVTKFPQAPSRFSYELSGIGRADFSIEQ
jgi:2-keto-4-pentenoate hydratase